MIIVDIATISAILLGTAAVIGICLTIVQLRQLVAQRKTDMLVRLSPWFDIGFSEWQEISNAVVSCEFKDYGDFVEKYGPVTIDKPLQKAIATVSNYYEGIGILLKRGLVDKELIHDLYGGLIVVSWEKISPIVVEIRKRSPDAWVHFELLYRSMKGMDDKKEP